MTEALFCAGERALAKAKQLTTVISGDYHFFQVVDFPGQTELPGQLVVGTGGVRLDPVADDSPHGGSAVRSSMHEICPEKAG